MASTTTAASNAGTIAVVEDSTSATPNIIGGQLQGSTAGFDGAATVSAEENFPPQAGLHYLQAMEVSYNSVTVTFGMNQIGYLLYQGEY